MAKNRNNKELWLFLVLKNASERYGVNLDEWFNKRPVEMKLGLTEFKELITKMEKNDLIKHATIAKGHYFLTEKGRKKFIKETGKLHLDEFLSFASWFPEIELKVRIQKIQSFLISILLLIIVWFWGIQPMFDFWGIIELKYLFSLLFGAIYFGSILYAGITTGNLLFLWFIDFKEDSLWIYKENIWKYKNWIIYGFSFVIIIIFANYFIRIGITSFDNVLYSFFILFVGIIFSKLSSKIDDHKRTK